MKGCLLVNRVFVLFLFLFVFEWGLFGQNRLVTIDDTRALAGQFVTSNTTYYIEKNVDLKGGTITIPKNSTLFFNGGALCNGVIIGQNTILYSAPTYILKNVQLRGDWIVTDAYAEWFGAIPNSTVADNRRAIQNCLDSFNTVKLLGVYYLHTSDKEGVAIRAHEGALIEGTKTPYPSNMMIGLVASGDNIKIILELSTAVVVKNIGIKGTNSGGDRNNKIIGIYTNGTSRIHFSDIQISNCGTAMDCVTYLTRGERITAFYCVRGLLFHGTEKSQYTSVSLDNCFVFSTLDYAYRFEKIIYSSLNTCAADFIGYNSSNQLLISDEYRAAYTFEKCSGISMNACGSENCVHALSLDSCDIMSVDACHFTSGFSEKLEPLMNRFIYMKNCFNTRLNIKTEIRNFPKDNKYVVYSHYTADAHNCLSASFKNVMLVKSTGMVSSKSITSAIKYE